MATISRGYSFGATEQVTAAKLHSLVDSATITAIQTANISDLQITNAKVADVSGAKFTNLNATPSGAGSLPIANLDSFSTVNPTNLLSNGDFENWSAGTSAAPDGWTAIVNLDIDREATIIKLGTYSARIKTTSGGSGINQTIHTVKGIEYWKGRTIIVSGWVRCDEASKARIIIGDGITDTYNYETVGDSAYHLITATKTISNSATELKISCYLDSATATSYFDGIMLTEGASAFAFADKPAGEGVWSDYSATSTIVGWSSFAIKTIYIKKMGKMVFVSFSLSGISNSTSVTFTLPYATATGSQIYSSCYAVNNDVVSNNPGLVAIYTSTITIYRNNILDNWTASGTKITAGQFWYESA